MGRNTLEHIKLYGDLVIDPDDFTRGMSFATFTRLRSLDIEDMLLLGRPEGWISYELNPGYDWTTSMPHLGLSSILPPSLE